jgi:cation diffusion facilitator family transporter
MIRTPDKRLYRSGLRLEYFTVAYNVAEAAASILFGILAGSIALVGFGLDSVVESLSGGILIWRLRQHDRCSQEAEEKIEKRAMRFVAVSFFTLGACILYEAVNKLVRGEVPEASMPGIIIALASIIIMPLLALRKQRVGKAIGSQALVADSKETLACAALSVALLLGLGANYLFGFWQADPIAGLVIVIFLVREGAEVWQESFEKECDEEK